MWVRYTDCISPNLIDCISFPAVLHLEFYWIANLRWYLLILRKHACSVTKLLGCQLSRGKEWKLTFLNVKIRCPNQEICVPSIRKNRLNEAFGNKMLWRYPSFCVSAIFVLEVKLQIEFRNLVALFFKFCIQIWKDFSPLFCIIVFTNHCEMNRFVDRFSRMLWALCRNRFVHFCLTHLNWLSLKEFACSKWISSSWRKTISSNSSFSVRITKENHEAFVYSFLACQSVGLAFNLKNPDDIIKGLLRISNLFNEMNLALKADKIRRP